MHISPASQREVRVSMLHIGLSHDWAQLYRNIKETHVTVGRKTLKPLSVVVLTTQHGCLAGSSSPQPTPPSAYVWFKN